MNHKQFLAQHQGLPECQVCFTLSFLKWLNKVSKNLWIHHQDLDEEFLLAFVQDMKRKGDRHMTWLDSSEPPRSMRSAGERTGNGT